jgi:hypothetical protein
VLPDQVLIQMSKAESLFHISLTRLLTHFAGVLDQLYKVLQLAVFLVFPVWVSRHALQVGPYNLSCVWSEALADTID